MTPEEETNDFNIKLIAFDNKLERLAEQMKQGMLLDGFIIAINEIKSDLDKLIEYWLRVRDNGVLSADVVLETDMILATSDFKCRELLLILQMEKSLRLEAERNKDNINVVGFSFSQN